MGFLARHADGKPLVILEMANNHQGDVEHGIRMVQAYARLHDVYGDRFRFAFKFQYRDLDTLIHPDHRGSDLKYIRRFEDTRLTDEDWGRLLGAVRSAGMLAACTPFDTASVDRVVANGFDFLKVASCSFTDWPLLERVVTQRLPVIASVGGSDDDEISSVAAFFHHRNIDLALLFCVGMYPTAPDDLSVAMVSELARRYPDVEVGFSTHEGPDERMAAAVAYGAGARIFEKHVALPTEQYPKNAYSVDVEECEAWLQGLAYGMRVYGSVERRVENLETERGALRPLMRAAYASQDVDTGDLVTLDKVDLAIPAVEGGLVAQDFSKFREISARRPVAAGQPLLAVDVSIVDTKESILRIRNQIRQLIRESGVVIPNNIRLEISHHYGLAEFDRFGLCMLTVLNGQYCKKLLFLLPGQLHPEQYHKIKHETFYILYGDLELKLDGSPASHKVGDIVSIMPGVKHTFWSKHGAVIEELSTESISGDSYYTDDAINHAEKRKSYVELV